jgi:sodium/potassium/calcium exchanger 6
MDLLVFISILTELPNILIGFTLLAWGNSLGDFVADRALAKIGYGVMAVTGCFAGQLFNLLIGFGVICTKSTLSNGPLKFDLFNPDSMHTNLLAIVIIGYHFVNLV